MTKYSIQKALDGTLKFRFTDDRHNSWEAAHFYVPGRERPHIVCISTQIGCPIGCIFCATATEKFRRNLTDEEILEEVETVVAEVAPLSMTESAWEVSFMGMGEPLANLQNVLKSIDKIHYRFPGMTRVSLSSTGPVSRIDALTDASPTSIPIHLQISLHATTTEGRRQLVPKTVDSLTELVESGLRFHEKTGDKVCVNYVLVADRNDRIKDARWLGKLNRNAFYVKLSELNLVRGTRGGLNGASRMRILEFARVVQDSGVSTKIFVGDGLDIHASCGQMASTPRELVEDENCKPLVC